LTDLNLRCCSIGLPEEILVYRDGVGETMYDLVLNIELPHIWEACMRVKCATT